MQADEREDSEDDAEGRRGRERFAGPSARSEFHALPNEQEIAAMGRLSTGHTNGDQGNENGSMLGRESQHSNFDAVSLERMSKSHARNYVGGAAVNVTRTLSLDGKEWEHLQLKANMVLVPPRRHADRAAADESASSGRRPSDQKFRSIFNLPMISPFSNFSLGWHMLMLCMDLTYTAFIVPIGVGFDISDTAWTWGAVCDFTAGFFFMVDMVLGFHTGYVISYNFRKRVVMNGKQVAKWYIQRGSFAVDLLSSIAWITQVLLVILTLAGENQRRLASQIQIMRLLRLVRLGRLFRAMFLSTAGQGIMMLLSDSRKVNTTVIYFMQLLYAIAVLINFLGCFWYWVASQEGFDNTWVTAFSPYVDLYGSDGTLTATEVRTLISKPNLYLTSVYWAITTVATVGYGDIAPQTPAEEGVAIFVFVVGIIFFGVIVGSLTQLLQSASKNARKASVYREKMDHVESWISQRQLPPKLRKKIRDYYGQFWLRQAEESDEAELLQELPHTLRTEALWAMSRKTLSAIHIFKSLPVPLQFLIASKAKPRKLPPGFDISTQGGAATRMFLVEFGKIVPVYNDIEGEVQADDFLLNAPSLLQEIDPRFQKNVRGYRTLSACGVWEWNVVSLLGVCRHHPGLYEHLARDIMQWMQRKLSAEPENWHPDLHRFVDEINEKLDIRSKALEASALRRNSFAASEIADIKLGEDAAAYMSHMSPNLMGAEAFLKGAEADFVPPEVNAQQNGTPSTQRPSTVTFQDEVQAKEKKTPQSPFEPAKQPEEAVALEMQPSNSDLGSEIESFVGSAEIDPSSGAQDIAATLQSIQEQLTDLRHLVRRRADNSD